VATRHPASPCRIGLGMDIAAAFNAARDGCTLTFLGVFFTMSRILVTGASGFIGSHLCRKLMSSGAEIWAVSRQHQPRSGSIKWLNVDLTDLTAVRSLIKEARASHIYNLASLVTGSRELQITLPVLQNNFLATFNLLLAVTENGSGKIILAGSCEEPGPDDYLPCSPYAAAKASASLYARMFHALYKTEIVIARIFMVYGPCQRDASKLIPYVASSMLKGESPKLSSGIRLVDWVYVDDVVDGLIACAANSDANGNSVDLGSGTLVSIRDIVLKLHNIIPNAPDPFFGAISDRPFERLAIADVKHSCRLVGWQPVVGLEEGLARTVDWYRAT
jgi:UDP-glucose 4-epimerase